MITIRRKADFRKNFYEESAWSENGVVCGIDEVGRGCLAGPVVTAAVILKAGKKSRLIKDSKELVPADRLRAYEWIKRNGSYALGIAHPRIIDQRNIYQATLIAMKRAVMQLLATGVQKPRYILVDAMPLSIDFLATDIVAFPFGESKSISISAASIVAKVTRDKLMEQLNGSFPGYAFDQHKGYCTALHRQKLHEHTASLIHRKTFIDHFDKFEDKEIDEPQVSGNNNDQARIW